MPLPETAGIGSLLLPEDENLATCALEIFDDLGERIGNHEDHSEDCPWRDGDALIYGFGLALSELVALGIRWREWTESEVDEFLAAVRANIFAKLKAHGN